MSVAFDNKPKTATNTNTSINAHSKSGTIRYGNQSLNMQVGGFKSIGTIQNKSSSFAISGERETNTESNPLIRTEAAQIKEFAKRKKF